MEIVVNLTPKPYNGNMNNPDQDDVRDDESDILEPASESLSKDTLYSKKSLLSTDESLDFEDEEWLNAKIAQFKISKDCHYIKGTLSCALCFTPVSFYYNKYLFLLNYRIDILQYESKYIENCEILVDVIQRDTVDDTIYHPVKCMECDLEIGLQDVDSVVHFYQVFAS